MRTIAALAAAAAVVAFAFIVFPEDPALPAGGLGVEESLAVSGTVVAHTWGTEVKLEVEGLPAVVAGTVLGVDGSPITCALNGAVLREQACSGRHRRRRRGDRALRPDSLLRAA